MHLKRLLTAALLLPLLYIYITKLPPVYFAVLILTVSVITQSEFYSMYKVKGFLRYTGIIFGVLIIVSVYAANNLFPHILLFSFLVITATRLFLKASPSSALSDIAPVVIGLLYIPGLLGYQIDLRKEGAEWIIFLYGTVWGADSFAYYIGKGIGKRKLYESVSPNKTVAGAFGSIAGGIVCAVLIKTAFIHFMPLVPAMIIGAAVGVSTIIGDLVESMFKRDAGVKDSSSLIPGHGGLLDKIDGALFVAPLLYWMLHKL
jgi:phosphatidate cytidylyltransferase